jgi:hypothetical protein
MEGRALGGNAKRRNAFASAGELGYPWVMRSFLAAASHACLACAVALNLAACGASKPPRQAESSDALAEKGDKSADMSTGEDSSGNVKTDPNEKSGAEKMHEKCCGQCKAAAATDRSGAKPETIPCTDFTSGLDAFCLEHFRGRKTMASECK